MVFGLFPAAIPDTATGTLIQNGLFTNQECAGVPHRCAVHTITMYRSAQARLRSGWARDASLDSAQSAFAQARLRFGLTRNASLDSARALWSAQAGLRFGWTRSVFVFYNRRKSTNRSGIQSGVQPPHSRVLRTIQSASRVASRRWVAMQRAASGGRGLRGNPKRRRAAALQSTACYPKRFARGAADGRSPMSALRERVSSL